jgi:hypothetical protein
MGRAGEAAFAVLVMIFSFGRRGDSMGEVSAFKPACDSQLR